MYCESLHGRLTALFLVSVLLISFSSDVYAAGWVLAPDRTTWHYYHSELPSGLPEDRARGWFRDASDGCTYYLDPSDGHMVDGIVTIDGAEYVFVSHRDRGNYFPDDLGFHRYQANGLAPYGSLMMRLGRPDPDATRRRARRAERREASASDAAREHTAEETPDDTEAPDGSASPSDLAAPGDAASPSDLATPGDAADPAGAEGAAEPAHAGPCIITDPWEVITAQPGAYAACILQGCTKEIDLVGEEIVIPETTAADLDTPGAFENYLAMLQAERPEVHYPIIVTPIAVQSGNTLNADPGAAGTGSSDASLVFAMAEANPDLMLPMQAAPTFASEAGLQYTNGISSIPGSAAGGFAGSFLWQVLYGSRTQPYSFYVTDSAAGADAVGAGGGTEAGDAAGADTGTGSTDARASRIASRSYGGLRLVYTDAAGNEAALPTRAEKHALARGYTIEMQSEMQNVYTLWNKRGARADSLIGKYLYCTALPFFLFSEYKLSGQSALSLSLQVPGSRFEEKAFWEKAADTWTGGSYWLASYASGISDSVQDAAKAGSFLSCANGSALLQSAETVQAVRIGFVV